MKKEASPRDIELYLSHFEYVILAEKQERMRELGITPEHEKGNQLTIEQRKATILQRLRKWLLILKNRNGEMDNEIY